MGLSISSGGTCEAPRLVTSSSSFPSAIHRYKFDGLLMHALGSLVLYSMPPMSSQIHNSVKIASCGQVA